MASSSNMSQNDLVESEGMMMTCMSYSQSTRRGKSQKTPNANVDEVGSQETSLNSGEISGLCAQQSTTCLEIRKPVTEKSFCQA